MEGLWKTGDRGGSMIFVEGGANPQGGGANIHIFQIFCMNLKIFLAVGGAPLDPPMGGVQI